MSILKKQFVKAILEDEGRRFLKNQGREIRAQLYFHTKRLIEQRSHKVTGGDDMDGQLSITIPIYNRFLDLRKNTRKKGEKGRNRRGYRIYNRFAQGHYIGIAFRLQHDFTDEVVFALKKQWLKNPVTNTQ